MNQKYESIGFFLPCLADLYYSSIGHSAMEILKRAGCNVDYPDAQTCCGQWAVNMGHGEKVKKMAQHFIRIFEPYQAIVSPSASCVLTVRSYPEIFENDPLWIERSKEIAAKTFEISDYLVNRKKVIGLGAVCWAKATLHDSCHSLRRLGLRNEARILLNQVDKLELVEMADPEICCGFGGAFMAKYPVLSRTMANDKINQALETKAELLVFTEPGCLLNVASALKTRRVKLKAVHLVEILANSGGYYK